jgi:ABC-type transporter Mla maintaining outer membrane lipid asymmetry ATPase subunit MlaF
MSGGREPAIIVSGLCKSFGQAPVLDRIDLTVTNGTVFALLGPNGAGKTTIVRILSTLITADAGEARWLICTTSAALRDRRGSPSCSAGSISSTPPGGWCPPTRAECAGGWIWP